MPSVSTVLHAAVSAVGGEDRPGQVQMAEAVEKALHDGEHLLVQAGTGTGKSLGYLVPALLHHKRVVVATATLNLQHQLVERDIPALKDAAEATMDEVPRHAVVKGRSNYPCLHRVREGAPDDQGTLEIDVPTGTVGTEVVALREWAEEQAQAGAIVDRDDAPSHGDRAWRAVSVSARECLGAARCPFGEECFAERSRAEAHEAQVIVTNHALLAIDAIESVPMLPEYDVVVVDEAHELAARVTQATTDELTATIVERASRRARSVVETVAVDDLNDAADALADILSRTEEGRIDVVEQPLQAALELVRDSARSCLSDLPKEKQDEPDAARQQSRAMLDDVRKIAERMAGKTETDVLWLTDGRNGRQLHVAPIDVSGSLRDKLFTPNTVVLTSATLKLGGTFEGVARSLGLVPGDDVVPWEAIDVGSPFDYGRQGILYVAKHLPPPGRDGLGDAQVQEIAELVEAAGGRTLGLFSSRRAAEHAAERVRLALPDHEILCQGDAQLTELARRFADDPAVSLFGTLSLWQGVDVPGDTCTLVIIDRIPFPRPDDPLMSARQRLVERHGGNGFMAVAATHAALLLAQGSGRLIRRASDKGVVAILDPRIATARYGSYLAGSLPPMWRTTDPKIVRGSLRRLAGTPVTTP